MNRSTPALAAAALILQSLASLAVLAPAPARAQDAEAGKKKAETCATCHGPGGNSADPLFPVLAGQTARYLYLQLKDFKEGRRTEPTMAPFLEDLTRQDMLDLAAYYAAQKHLPIPFKPDPAKVAKGKARANSELCTMCHLGGFRGQNEIPRVAGQYYDYVVKQMKDFRSRARTNDAGNMTSVSKTLTDEDIEELAQYLATLD